VFWSLQRSDGEVVFETSYLPEKSTFLGQEETKSPEVTSWELDVPMEGTLFREVARFKDNFSIASLQ
jgi:hypothetical protein